MTERKTRDNPSSGRSYLMGSWLPGWIGDESNGWPVGEDLGFRLNLPGDLPRSWLGVGMADNPNDESE